VLKSLKLLDDKEGLYTDCDQIQHRGPVNWFFKTDDEELLATISTFVVLQELHPMAESIKRSTSKQ